MLRDGIRLTLTWLRRAINQPFEELNRWQRAARFAYDLGQYGARQLREDRAPQMASALAFRTLFGLAPVLVVAMIFVRAIKGTDAILQSLHVVLVGAGLDKIRVVQGSDGTDAVAPDLSLAVWIENLTAQLASVNLSAIGWVGLVLILYAAIGLMVTIENSFNIVYRAPDGRPWTRRVPLYWFILTISPLLVGLASYVNDLFAVWVLSVDTWQWLLFTAKMLWSFGLVWLFVFTVYNLIPCSVVNVRPSLVGSFVAAVLLTVGKNTLGAYLGSAFVINQLYGTLGLVPLFMLWVYLMWLAVLFGLQVSATLQILHGRSLKELDPPQARSGIIDPTCVLTIMEVVAEHFTNGDVPITIHHLAETTSLPEATVVRIVDRLVNGNWLHRVEHAETAISLARPPEKMHADALIALGYQMVDEGAAGRCTVLFDELREAQKSVAQGVTLDRLVSPIAQRS